MGAASIKAMTAALVAVGLGLGVAACGGDDGDDEGAATNGAPSAAGDDLTIDPESGPPGTVISWEIANCDPESDKSVSIYLDAPGGEGEAKAVVEGPDTKEDSGTVTVPAGTAAGEYTVIGTCLTVTEKGGGQVQFGVKDAGELLFTVTE